MDAPLTFQEHCDRWSERVEAAVEETGAWAGALVAVVLTAPIVVIGALVATIRPETARREDVDLEPE